MANPSTKPAGFKTGPGRHAHAHANGDGARPTADPDDRKAADATLRLIHGRAVAKKTRAWLNQLDAWCDLTEFVLSSEEGVEAGKPRMDLVKTWLSSYKARHQKEHARIFAALMEAVGECGDDGPGDEPDEAAEPEWSLESIDSEEFFGADYPIAWSINGVEVRDETAVMGGPSKALKTSILVDKAVSQGTATPFLGKFPVPVPMRVLLISAESGRRVIQSTAKRVCEARGISTAELNGRVRWSFKAPQLTNPKHMTALRKEIVDYGIEGSSLDPFYLTLMGERAGIDPSNMFEMGPILRDFAEMCIGEGCTPTLAHHFTKKRDDAFAPPEMAELAYAGIGQFMRQWMLVAPRERFDAERGLFKLHFGFGGSAGHCGEFALDIEVGKLGADLDCRKWAVTINSPSEFRNAKLEQQQAEQARKAEEKLQRQRSEQASKESDAMGEALAIIAKQPDRRIAVNTLRTSTGWRDDKAKRVLFLLADANHVRPAHFTVPSGNGTPKGVDGYELIPDSGALS